MRSAASERSQSSKIRRSGPVSAEDYHTDEQVVGYYNTGARMNYWEKPDVFRGGLRGMKPPNVISGDCYPVQQCVK